jgi:hypothetical protein
MSKGGEFGVDAIAHFNGGLFADAEVIPLLPPEIAQLVRANERDWSNVEPSIFGTLFERTLDPAKRSQSALITRARKTSSRCWSRC